MPGRLCVSGVVVRDMFNAHFIILPLHGVFPFAEPLVGHDAEGILVRCQAWFAAHCSGLERLLARCALLDPWVLIVQETMYAR